MTALTISAPADIDDLRITEVRPDTDEVEVTNIGVDPVTTASTLFFCHNLNYGSTVPSGTTFAPGESKTFNPVGLDNSDSDIWLYRDGDFDSSASIITGMTYGPSPGGPRTSVAVAAGIWSDANDSVPLPLAGESLQLTGDPASADSWFSAPPDFNQAFGVGTEILDPLPPIPKGTIAIELQTVATGLISPVGVTVTDDPSDDRLFIYDQRGTVTIVASGTQLVTPFLDVSARIVPDRPGFDERGLLGLAFHPDFASNPRVYTYTSEPVSGPADFTNTAPLASQDHQSVITEWQVDSGDPDLVDPSTRREILRIDQPQFNHDAGTIRFGPDGFLFIALGDGGAGDDQGDGHVPGGNAQDTSNIYGTILRIDVDQAVGSPSANGEYNIPPDNPFVGGAGLDEIFVHGLRNPFIFSFDQGNFTPGAWEMYIGDAGQNDIEEVTLITPGDAGGNLGWRHREGRFFFDPNGDSPGFVTTVPVTTEPVGLIDPIYEYDQDDGMGTVDNGVVVIGGFVYRGSAIPALDGLYVFGDFGTTFAAPGDGRLWYADAGNNVLELQLGTDDRRLEQFIKGFGQDRDGEIYVCVSTALAPTGTTGEVLRIVPVFTTAVRHGMLYR